MKDKEVVCLDTVAVAEGVGGGVIVWLTVIEWLMDFSSEKVRVGVGGGVIVSVLDLSSEKLLLAENVSVSVVDLLPVGSPVKVWDAVGVGVGGGVIVRVDVVSADGDSDMEPLPFEREIVLVLLPSDLEADSSSEGEAVALVLLTVRGNVTVTSRL